MGKTFKWIGIVLLIVIGANAAHYGVKIFKKGFTAPDGKHDVIDVMVGKIGVDKFVEIKNERDTFNLPAFKTSLMMYQTQHGRFPNTIEEFEQDGDVSPSITRDHWGTPYRMKVLNNRTVILNGAGKDKIEGTTDDVQYKINM